MHLFYGYQGRIIWRWRVVSLFRLPGFSLENILWMWLWSWDDLGNVQTTHCSVCPTCYTQIPNQELWFLCTAFMLFLDGVHKKDNDIRICFHLILTLPFPSFHDKGLYSTSSKSWYHTQSYRYPHLTLFVRSSLAEKWLLGSLCKCWALSNWPFMFATYPHGAIWA
jgi:hypothetical protein